MANLVITYWRDIPSAVSVKAGRKEEKRMLADRFQEAIDEAAMRLGESDADAYMEGWRKGEWIAADGTPTDVVHRIAEELEADLTEDRLNALLDELGPAQEA